MSVLYNVILGRFTLPINYFAKTYTRKLGLFY